MLTAKKLHFIPPKNDIFWLALTTSKARFLKYSTRLLSTLRPINSVVTKITLEKATSKAGKPYAIFTFEAVNVLSPEEAAQAKAYAQQFMEIVNATQTVPELAEAS